LAALPASLSMTAMRPPAMPTSAVYGSPPLPSTVVPPRTIKSSSPSISLASWLSAVLQRGASTIFQYESLRTTLPSRSS
jgi:hypothetical protein